MTNSFLLRALSQTFKGLVLLKHSVFRWLDMTIWPLTVFFAFGFLVMAFAPDPSVIGIVVLGYLGWQAVHQSQMGIVGLYLDEYWSNSLAHLWVTPIRIYEFVFGGMILGAIKYAATATLILLSAELVYNYTIPAPGEWVFAIALLFLFGACIGMLNVALLFLIGENAIALAWTLSDIFVVLSGVYYSISILPGPLQTFALALPSTHAFEIIKSVIGHGTIDWPLAVGLTLAWLVATYALVNRAFHAAKKQGKLIRVM